ncbi:MAG: helix-hairpin-helix domain-containing protein [Saprospiraceae bacterium]|nr:helix-hairpin-helix domain-containing protein [Saprospiraceae bacterium]
MSLHSTLLAMLCLACTTAIAQFDTLSTHPSFIQDQLESYLDNLDEESDFQFNTLGEDLVHFFSHPLSVNEASATDLRRLGMLTDLQINNLIAYRNTLGDLVSIYELQSVPHFTTELINLLRRFVTVAQSSHAKQNIWKMMSQGSNQLFLRSGRILQKKRGFSDLDGTGARYIGDPNRYYARFSHRFENKLSYGVTTEKDPGETFFHNGQPEFTSAHLYINDLSGFLKTVALGDYAISLGQGLIMHSGFGRGKGAYVSNIRRSGRAIRPYTSVDETRYLRGAALTFELGRLSLMCFGSASKRDGNLQENDAAAESFISSLQSSGLHRTEGERVDKGVVKQHLLGGSLAYKSLDLQISLNALRSTFDLPLIRNPRPDNTYRFNGSELHNFSLDYTYIKQNFNLFGESAYSDNGGWATVHGALIGLSKNIDLSAFYRNISVRYQALQSNAFLESTSANDEKGIYLGIDVRLHSSFRISMYADHFSFSWLKFLSDSPSRGQEYLARVTYQKKRNVTAYFQYRSERKPVNYRPGFQLTNSSTLRSRQYFRLHFSNQLHKNLELRTRLEVSRVTNKPGVVYHGLMIYQDAIYRSIDWPLSFSARVAYFDIEDYAARIYAYENDLLFNFSIPSYFDQGFRFYVNIRWRLSNAITMEGRWEQTRFNNVSRLSSGLEEIEGNLRSRLKVQFKFSF